LKECYEYTVKMNMYLDGELPVNQIPALLRHIESCPRCQARFEALKVVAFETRSLSITPPDHLHSSIMEHIKKNTGQRKRKRIINIRPLALAACAAVLILFSGTLARLNNVYLFGRGKSESVKSESLRMYSADSSGAGQAGNTQEDGQAADPEKGSDTAGAKSSARPGSAQAESGTGSTTGGSAGGRTEGALIPDKNMSAQNEQTEEQKGKTLLLEAVMPEGYAFYRIWEGQGQMPEILQSESKVSYDDSGITVIYLKNDKTTWGNVEDALIEASYKPIGDRFGGTYPQADSAAAQGLLILVSEK